MTQQDPSSHAHGRRLRLDEALLLLIFIVFPLDKVFSVFGTGTLDAEGLTLTHMLTLTLGGVCIWNALWSKDATLPRLLFGSLTSILIMCFIGVSLLSVLVSRTPANAVVPIAQRVAMFAFYILVVYTIRDRFGLRLCILAFVISVIFTASAGAYEIITGDAVLKGVYVSETRMLEGLSTERTGKYRIQGLAYDPDNHAAWMIIQLGLFLYLLTTTRRWRWRILGSGLMLLVMINLTATSSRAAWLGTALVMGVFLVTAPLPHKRMTLSVLAAATFVAFVSLILLTPNLAVLDRIRGSTSGSFATTFRAEMLRVTLRMASDNPWLGVGTGNFREELPRYVSEAPFLPKEVVPYPHNIYAAILAENGSVGLIVYCSLHLAVVWQIVTCFHRARDVEAKILAAGLLASFLGFFCCLNFYNMGGSKYGWTIMALAWAATRVLPLEGEPVGEARFGAVPRVASLQADGVAYRT